MFRLEDELARWRSTFSTEGRFTISQLDELEAHLLDTIEDKVAGGMDEREAFEQAVALLGQPRQLAREFHKIRPVKDRVFVIARAIYLVTFIAMYVYGMFVNFTTRQFAAVFDGMGSMQAFTLTEVIAVFLGFVVPITMVMLGFSYLRSAALKYGAMATYLLVAFYWSWDLSQLLVVNGAMKTSVLILLASLVFEGARLKKALLWITGISIILYAGILYPFAFEAWANNPEVVLFTLTANTFDVIIGSLLGYALYQRSTNPPANQLPVRWAVGE